MSQPHFYEERDFGDFFAQELPQWFLFAYQLVLQQPILGCRRAHSSIVFSMIFGRYLVDFADICSTAESKHGITALRTPNGSVYRKTFCPQGLSMPRTRRCRFALPSSSLSISTIFAFWYASISSSQNMQTGEFSNGSTTTKQLVEICSSYHMVCRGLCHYWV